MKKALCLIVIFLFTLSLFTLSLFAGDEYDKENENYHYFSQKAGMIPKGAHSIYLRTNDEFTGFSTLLIGYRYGLSRAFQFSIEGGVGINVYLASLVLHFKLYESSNYFFFLGLRNRSGFKYQNTEIELGNTALDDHRTGFFLASDLTAAFRFGRDRRFSLYYSVYPFFDIDITGRPMEIYFAPVHIGYEFRFKKNHNWSFAIETGYFFAINDVPETSWFNFPNLGNIGFYYTFD